MRGKTCCLLRETLFFYGCCELTFFLKHSRSKCYFHVQRTSAFLGPFKSPCHFLSSPQPTNFTNPVYATLYMGAHNSRNSLASTDEKKELLSQGDEDMSDPLA